MRLSPIFLIAASLAAASPAVAQNNAADNATNVVSNEVAAANAMDANAANMVVPPAEPIAAPPVTEAPGPAPPARRSFPWGVLGLLGLVGLLGARRRSDG